MGESIITSDLTHCDVCGAPAEVHHIIFGTANRELSERFGLIVGLCPVHHRTGKNAVHRNRTADLYYKGLAERRFKEYWKDYDFREVFGKEYQ